MASPQVVFTVDARHAPALAAWKKIQDQIDLAGKKMNDLGQAGGGAADSWSAKLGGVSTQIVKTAAGFAGFGSVLQGIQKTAELIGNEYQRMVHVRAAALAGVESALEPHGQMMLQDWGLNWNDPKLQSRLDRAMQKFGKSDPGEFYQVAKDLFSAKGGDLTGENLFAILEELAPVAGRTGMSTEDTKEFAGAIADVIRASRSQGREISPREAIGTAASIFGMSRPTDMAKFSKYSARGVNALMLGLGASYQEAAAFQSLVENELPDRSGRTSATAVVNFAEKLRETHAQLEAAGYAVPSREQFDRMSLKEKYQYITGPTEGGRAFRAAFLGQLSKDPRTREIASELDLLNISPFKGSLMGDAPARDALRRILEPPPGAVGRYEQLLGQAKTGKEAEALAESLQTAPARDELDRQQMIRAHQKGTIAAAKARNTRFAEQGATMELRAMLSEITGRGNLADTIDSFFKQLEAGKAQTPEALAALQKRIADEALVAITERSFSRPGPRQRERHEAYEKWKSRLGRPATRRDMLRFYTEQYGSEQDRFQFDTIERFIEDLPRVNRPLEPAAKGAAAPDDQSSLHRAVNRLHGVLDRGLAIILHDAGGRPLTRARSADNAALSTFGFG